MKRSLFTKHLKQMLLAVPAAALMLGAGDSRAVTSVGVNIEGSGYGFNAGAVVTQTAFGVDASGWFGTGTTGGGPGFNYGFTSGSMTVIPVTGGPGFGFVWTSGQSDPNYNPWSAYPSGQADPSNMPGYPGYPGDYQAIFAFLSPAYSLSLTNLNAQFPNGCVVQALTGTDSGNPQSVVVTGASAPQTLAQTNIYTRTTGGRINISTVSTALTNDTVTLAPAGDAGRAAISGVVITDKPVITVPPVGGSFMSGSTFNLNTMVAALPNGLAFQWRTNGVAISGANSATYTKAGATVADSANYDLVVANLYGSTTSAVVVVTIAPAAPYVWKGNVNTTWDIGGTANWTTNGGAATYADGVIVRFDDTATTANVAIAATVSPFSIIVTNNTLSYTIGGSSIAGTTGLAKYGTNSLTLSGANTFTGNIAINAGDLIYNSSVAQTVSSIISGAGRLTQAGTGTLTLGAANTYSGGTTVSQGTLAAARDAALGLTNNSLTLGDAGTGANPVTFLVDNGVSSGVVLANLNTTSHGSSQTVILNAGSDLGPNVAELTTTINLNGNVPLTIQATQTGTAHSTAQDLNWRVVGNGIPAGSTAITLDGTAKALRTSRLDATSPASSFTGDVVIMGAVTTQNRTYYNNDATNQNLGFTNNNITVNSGSEWKIVWGGETIGALNGSGNITLNCQSALNNIGLTLGNNNVNGSFAGAIGGGWGLLKVGTGTQELGGVNTYSGATTVNGGTLLVSGSITSATTVNGGTLLVSGSLTGATTVNGGTLTISGSVGGTGVTVATNANLVLVGSGSVSAPVATQPGGNLSLDPAGINTNSISGLTLGGRINLRISKTGGALANDQINGLTSVNYGGTLNVTNITSDATLLGVGDSFQLFAAGSYLGSFTSLNLPTLPGGLSWDITQLANTGTISVSGTAATPIFNPAAGGYIGAQSVTISSLSVGVTIRYTTNGWTTTNIYTTPITVPVNTSLTISAYASGGGFTPSPAASATYTTVDQAIWLFGSGGSWATPGNWTNNVPANGRSGTARFDLQTLGGDADVTLDGSWTIGRLVFGDVGLAYNWSVSPGSGSPLILDSTNKPVIDVVNGTTTISAALTGPNGLVKTGLGQLTLGGVNTLTGTTTISQGTLSLNNLSALPVTANIVLGDANTGALTPTLNLGVAGNITLGTLTVGANVTNATVAANPGGVTGFLTFSNITLNSALTLWSVNNSGNGWEGFQATGGNITGNGAGSGHDTLILTNSGTSQAYFQANNLTNNFLGNVHITAGVWRLQGSGGNNLVIPDTASLTIDSGASLGINTGSYSEAVDGLNGAGALFQSSGTAGVFSIGVSGGNGNFSGVISTGLAVTKSGAGTQILSGTNTYTGATVVSNGVLTLTGRLTGGGAVTLGDNATLNVKEQNTLTAIAGPGNFTLGTSGPTTLGFSSLSSTTVAPINAANVIVNGAVTINISGNLPVAQLPLIKYTTAKSGTGSFTLGSLPAGVSATLVDNIANKSVDLNVTASPISMITDLPSSTNYRYAGASYSLSVAAGGNNLTYLWKKNGSTPVGGNSATLTFSTLTTNDSGGYSVTVTNTSGSVQSATNHLVVLPTSGYDSLVMAAGSLAYWPLNEPTGPTAIDYSGGYNGTYGNSGVTYSLTGPVGNSVVALDGTARVAVPYTPALNPAGSFTVEAWINPANVTSSLVCPVSSFHEGTRSGWLIYVSTGGWTFRTYNQNGTTTAVNISGGTATSGVWSHVVAVWDGSKGYLYVDGVLTATSGTTTFVPNPDMPFSIGARADSAFYWAGSIGDVAFYGRALTPQEIQLHASNTPIQPVLNHTWSSGVLMLNWTTGTLQAAPEVTGAYTNVPAATSPYTVPLTGPRGFFRLAN